MALRKLWLIVIIPASVLVSCKTRETPKPQPAQVEQQIPPTGAEHSDHTPRYGGLFFMAMDNFHHLEGTLTAPGTFRIHLFDARTKPLPPEQVKEAEGTLYWGDLTTPPGTPLTLSEDGQTLELTLQREIKFPVTLTVLLRMPGSRATGAKPELFTFIFDSYSQTKTSNKTAMPMDHSQHKTGMKP